MLDETMSLRMEILQVLADHPGSACARTAHAVVYGWTDEQMRNGCNITQSTVKIRRLKMRMFINDELPANADSSFLLAIADKYRDALNFTHLLSDDAVKYAKRRLQELRVINPDISEEPLKRISQGAAPQRSVQRQHPTCSKCFMQHAGDC